MALDIDAAILAHSKWKSRLSSYLRNPDRSLDPQLVRRTDQCDLGKWLAGEGSRSIAKSELTTLEAAHAAFHQAASEIARRANDGDKVTEEVALGSRSPYAHATAQVVQLLTKLRK